MARTNFRVEQGIEIHDANGTASSWVLRGSGAPPGTTGPTDDAPLSSVWMDASGDGDLYQKKADTSSASDWERFVNESIYTALGITFDAEDMGTYTGTILTDNQDTKTNIQELETALEAIAGPTVSDDAITAATPTTVNTCLVDDCNMINYDVWVEETADETKREAFTFHILHDGTTSADATDAGSDNVTYAKMKAPNTGDIAGLTFTHKTSGSGGAQTIGLEISATAAITVRTRRTALTL